jgi:hypothetical protein
MNALERKRYEEEMARKTPLLLKALEKFLEVLLLICA